MCEEEIIKELESLSPSETAIIGILDLYNKEKQLRKELIMQDKTELEEFKDKVREIILLPENYAFLDMQAIEMHRKLNELLEDNV